MKILRFKPRVMLLCAAAFFAISLTACASNPATANCTDNERVIQSFSFAMRESPDIEILDSFYGIPNCPVTYSSEADKYNGKPMQGTSINGPMRRAHKLYVKWRIKSTGQEFEDTVDLRNRLPKDMTKHEVHFTIKESQLYVYLITPEPRPPDMPVNDGPEEYSWRKTITIYPDQTK